ncbi:hypothetical protein J3458_020685 [Metarhizium acridum]|uniref:uncharacterized protein n=1 Tax=Metarhizium acridum TaxID=92637 RepID=UPI001C6B2894|nr:hypothetical protein J3458_020685 [Metarhizium acridum]
MKFGSEPEFSARITQLAALNEALDLFQSRGYNGVDTACAYVRGHQEAFTREAGWKERGLVLAAKVKSPSNLGDNCAEKVLASVETSLAELGTDFVDILHLCHPDSGTPFQDTLQAIDKLHKAGRFSQFGVSNFMAF